MNRHPLRLFARSTTFALTLAILAACGTQAQQQDAIPPAQVSVAPVIVKDVIATDDFRNCRSEFIVA